MPVLMPSDARHHDLPGARFHSYVAPARGSVQLCAWRVELDAGTTGAAHMVSHEEVFLVLSGTPTLTVEDERQRLEPGAVALAPAGSTVCLDNEADTAASLWVTTSVGLTATMPSGQRVVPPWTR